MELIETIELDTERENGDYDIKEVKVTYDVRWEDNSFSYSYGSINAVHKDVGWGVSYEWDESLYTEEENAEIKRMAENRIDDVIKRAESW